MQKCVALLLHAVIELVSDPLVSADSAIQPCALRLSAAFTVVNMYY